MYCKNCGKENTDDAVFCVGCGSPLSVSNNEVSDGTTVLRPDGYAQFQQQTPNQSYQQATQTIPSANRTQQLVSKQNKKTIISLIVMIVFIAAYLISIISGIASSSNDELVPAADFDPIMSSSGDYVTTDIVNIIPFYEYYIEKDGERNITDYHCVAVNSNGDFFTVKVPYTYYMDTLFYLENSEEPSSLQSETVYGTVGELDSKIKTDLSNYLGEDYDLTQLYDNGDITIMTSPKTESNSIGMALAMLLIIPLIISIVVFIKSKNKLKKMKTAVNDYGDVSGIADSVKANSVYSDAKITASVDYIISNKDIFDIVSTKEVLCMYQYTHRTNFVVDEVSLIVVNKYGENIKYKYDKTDNDNIPAIVMKLHILCPNAFLGYSPDSMNYIKNNRITRIK